MNATKVATLTATFALSLAAAARGANPEEVRQLLETQRCPRCDLRGADLEGVNLRGADLTGANLQGASLRNADLRYANLRGANLTRATLIAADLLAVNLTDANLRLADVRGANLKDAVLTNANTCGWQRQDANLMGANLQDAGCFTNPASQPTETPTPTPTFDRAAAEALIRRWLEAKKQMFAPPYNRALLRNLTTGILYADSLNAINWLQNNNAFYEYGVQRIESVNRFEIATDKATVEAQVTEDYTLYENGQINREKSDFSTNLIRYNLERVNGEWKIADYQALD